MRFLEGLLGVFLLVALSQASAVPRRNYRNTEEILVPVAIIQDGEEIKEPAIAKDIEKVAELKNLQPAIIAENIVEAEQKLEAVEAVVEAQRRIDEAIVEEEIKEAIKEEQAQEAETENKLKTSLAEAAEIVAAEPEPVQQVEQIADLKAAADLKAVPIPDQIVAVVAESEKAVNGNEVVQQPDDVERQATQATPTQTTTQQNFVQQLIQNSPLGQFFSQITGQTAQTQVASDEAAATPAPALPGIFNPVTAVQNAAQSVVNTTTQAFQGLQQFASNLGNQFQSTLSGLGGQPADGTTIRPPGPIQQLVNTFIPQQAQPAAAQQGPLQGFLNIFQGRPQQQTVGGANITAADSAVPETQPAKEPGSEEPAEAAAAAAVAASAEAADQADNEVRGSGEANDSFEDSVQPDELIVVGDEAARQAEKTNAGATAITN